MKKLISGFDGKVLVCLVLFVVVQAGSLIAQKKRNKDKDIIPVPKEISENDRLEAEYYFIEGEKYFVLDNFPKAYEYYILALEKDELNPAINFKIAEVLAKNGEHIKALPYALTAVEQGKDNKYYYLLAANLYTTMSNLIQAAEIYESLLENVPGTEEQLFELAALYLYQKDFEKALSAYDRAEAAFGVMEQITAQKQKIYLSQNNLEMVMVEGEKLIDAFPGVNDYVISLAEILISNDQLDKASDYLGGVLEEEPNNTQASILLSEIYRKQGDTEKAMQLLESAFSDPELNFEAKVQMLAGYIAQLPDDKIEAAAIKLSERMIQAHPEESNAYAVSGDMYYQLGQNEKALEMYNKVLEMDQSNFGLWQNVINLEVSMSLYDEAIEHVETALELFPNQGALYYFGSAAHLIQKNYDQAIRLLEEGAKYVTANSELHSAFYGQLGDAYNGIEDHSKSDDSYKKALEINPNNDHVLNNFSYFLSLRKENLEEALSMSQKLVDKFPDNSTYLDTHAWVLYMLEKYKLSRGYLERALEDEVVSSTIVEHYGDVLYKLGEVENAVEQWERARDLDDASDKLDKKIADRKLYE